MLSIFPVQPLSTLLSDHRIRNLRHRSISLFQGFVIQELYISDWNEEPRKRQTLPLSPTEGNLNSATTAPRAQLWALMGRREKQLPLPKSLFNTKDSFFFYTLLRLEKKIAVWESSLCMRRTLPPFFAVNKHNILDTVSVVKWTLGIYFN